MYFQVVNNFDPLWAPILTHYELADNLRLNKALIKKHMKWLEPSVKQFLVCGTTGDGWILSDKLINDWLEILTEKNFLTIKTKYYLVHLVIRLKKFYIELSLLKII